MSTVLLHGTRASEENRPVKVTFRLEYVSSLIAKGYSTCRALLRFAC